MGAGQNRGLPSQAASSCWPLAPAARAAASRGAGGSYVARGMFMLPWLPGSDGFLLNRPPHTARIRAPRPGLPAAAPTTPNPLRAPQPHTLEQRPKKQRRCTRSRGWAGAGRPRSADPRIPDALPSPAAIRTEEHPALTCQVRRPGCAPRARACTRGADLAAPRCQRCCSMGAPHARPWTTPPLARAPAAPLPPPPPRPPQPQGRTTATPQVPLGKGPHSHTHARPQTPPAHTATPDALLDSSDYVRLVGTWPGRG